MNDDRPEVGASAEPDTYAFVFANDTRKLIDQAMMSWVALQETARKSWEHWQHIGLAIDAARQEIMRQLGVNSRASKKVRDQMAGWLRATGLDEIEKGARSRLQWCVDNLVAINGWLARLSDEQRLHLNHPNSVARAFKATLTDDRQTKMKRPSSRVRFTELEEALEQMSGDRKQALTEAERRAAEADDLRRRCKELEKAGAPPGTRWDDPVVETDVPTFTGASDDKAAELVKIIDGALHKNNKIGDAISRLRGFHRKGGSGASLEDLLPQAIRVRMNNLYETLDMTKNMHNQIYAENERLRRQVDDLKRERNELREKLRDQRRTPPKTNRGAALHS